MLAEFEKVEETQKEIDQLNISEDNQQKLIRQQKNKRKLETLPVAFTSTHSESPFTSSTQSTKSSSKENEFVHVEFVFHSNWGNDDAIGLTEVCHYFTFLFNLLKLHVYSKIFKDFHNIQTDKYRRNENKIFILKNSFKT